MSLGYSKLEKSCKIMKRLWKKETYQRLKNILKIFLFSKQTLSSRKKIRYLKKTVGNQKTGKH